MASSKVSIHTCHTLWCANQDALESIKLPFRLGPMGSGCPPFVPIAVIFVYHAPLSSNPFIPIDRLKKALSHLFDHYPHLTGRLKRAPNGSWMIERLDAGSELLEASCDDPLESFVSPSTRIDGTKLPGSGNSLLPTSVEPFSVAAACTEPVFCVQHTRFACGSVALGLRISHVICDAQGFFQLARHLMEIYRLLSSELRSGEVTTKVTLKEPPSIRPYLALEDDMTEEERVKARSYGSQWFSLEPPPLETAAPSETAGPVIVGRVLHFTSNQLSEIKSRAMSSRTHSTDHMWISTFDALVAFIAQAVFQSRVQINGGSTTGLITDILTSVNIRRALSLPSSYFGNALLVPSFSPSAELLSEATLGDFATAVHALPDPIPSCTSLPNVVQETNQWLAVQPDLGRVRIPFRTGAGGFQVSQWNKFGMYDGLELSLNSNDDDIVKPALVWPPFHPVWLACDGLAYFISPPPLSGSDEHARGIDVNLSLRSDVWETLDGNSTFAPFV
ncbi:hypothetical protein DL93DRAFT_2049950 [Clavulina sp. PMI_390]|nr:hypothetical protein DL93DRAFT_2049950 [Clavulina sp. PMI_390]